MLDRINAPNRIIPAAGSIRRAHGRSSGDSRPGFFNQLTGLQARYLDGGENGQFKRTVNGTARVIDQSRTGTPRQMQPGRSYEFASGDEVVMGTDVGNVGDGEFAISLWMRHQMATGNHGLLTKDTFSGADNGIYLYITNANSDKVSWWNGSGTVTAGESLNDDAWHHIAVVRTSTASGGLAFYVDGVLVQTGTESRTLTNARAMRLAAFDGGGGGFFIGAIFDTRFYDRAITAAEIATIASMGLDSEDIGTTNPQLWLKCDEAAGTVAYDSSGSGNDGAITAATIANFHNATTNDIYSFQNELGYTDSSGTLIPRHESNPTLDAAGNALQYSGQAPRDAIVSSPCGTAQNTEYVESPHLVGSETVVSHGGTATPTVSAGRITFTAGTVFDLVLSNGDTYTACEGNGGTLHDTANGNTLSLSGVASTATWWAATQNETDTLTTHGYRRSGSVNIPALQDGSGLAADGNPLTHGPGFLALGQSLDVSGGEANSPYMQQLAALLADTDYDSGDNSEADALFARVNAGGDDRILTTVPALTGDDLTRMNAYTE